ncbi:PD-(D/E)XK nuclease family protein [Daejeonella lutea]|uniref:PD-(D/E)XK nuclease superfamily protein n=1 Tax=Daejeonella lutea TaxID=572036 RepID=A0A1T5D8Z5_9SPHI|nr:PD-(D/E)XK nuclease family protein [Daejeonella lutea]SKB68232.1 PD-(D/E)XK nuclease superfamily protein [Daejeonella lutea]
MMNRNKFLFRVAEDLLIRFGDDLQNVAIVFNNKRPQLFLKKYLSEISGKPIWSPHFYTIQQFFSRSTTRATASQLKQFFVLFTEYNLLLKSEGREPVTADVFYPLAEIIVSDFSQIDYYLADPAKVFNLIGSIAELQYQFPNFEEEQLEFMKSFWSSFSGEKQSKIQEKFIEMWHRMPVLYQNFHNKLQAHDLVSSAKMYRNLAEGSSAVPGFLDQFSHVVFVGFNALSKAEELLFKKWQDDGICSFYFDADEHYFGDLRQEAGHFIRRNINTVGLLNRFEISENTINNPAKDFTIVQALGNIAQGKLLSNLLSNVDDEKPDSRAIILADESLLLPVLQTVSDDSLNITMGYPFEQSAVFGLCDLWLGIQEEIAAGDQFSVSYNRVLSFILNPLVNIDDIQRARVHQEIVEGKKARFDLAELQKISKVSALIFSPYKNPSDSIRNFGSLLLLVSEELENLRKLDSLLITEAVKTLNLLLDSFEEIEQNGDFSAMGSKFVFRTIRRALAGLSVPFDGEPLSGLQVMGLLESRCLDFDELIVLGMNEGVLPKVSITPSFIPDNVRRAFGLPVLENQNSIFSYFFYRLLHCANKVTLVYNGITDEKSTGEESRFIKQLEFETNCKFRHLIQQNQPVENYGEQRIIVEKIGFVRERLEKYLHRNPEVKYEKKISATAFTDYVSCPLKFFFSRVAGLKEPKDLPDQIGANLVGTMLHTVMESFYRTSVGIEISADFIMQRQHELPALCADALALALNTDPKNPIKKQDALQQIVLKVIEQYALKILKHDRSLAPFHIIELENRESYTPLVKLQVSGGEESVRLLGIIDRVDSHHGKIRIVDYKTGKDQLKYKDFDSLFSDEGKDQNKALIQTLFYTYVYEKSKGVKNVEPHLYTVNDFKGGTLFSEKRKGGLQLSDQNLDFFKEQFELKLIEKLNEVFDVNIPFVQTKNLDTCKYCQFKKICQR